MGGNVEDGQLGTLPDQQRAVCLLIAKDPTITAVKIAEALKIRVNTVEKRIAVLKEKGVLVRVGGTRGHWRVVIK